MSRTARGSARFPLTSSCLMLTLLAVSCGTKGTAQKDTSGGAPPAVTATEAPLALTDANVAAIVLAADRVDIANAKMALSKTQNDAVKAFANQMLVDHASVSEQVTALATKLSLKPEDDATSRQLEAGWDVTRQTVGVATGAAFDKAYVDNEVVFHQAVLDMLDKTLLPAATHADLKTLLEGVRPMFEAHLDHSKHVQASLPA